LAQKIALVVKNAVLMIGGLLKKHHKKLLLFMLNLRINKT
jgi:hypothetical protein